LQTTGVKNEAVNKGYEEQIRARIIQGFAEFNKGHEAWLKWCDTLYEPDSHYNIYGNRLTLEGYKSMMGQVRAAGIKIELGDFYNMIVQGDWASIRYTATIINTKTGESHPAMMMEWVLFKNNPQPIGARVVEGWALSDRPVSLK
jgi:hypothetical protein